jgi:uncharacterized protein
LVHVSALANKFVKDPHSVVKAGDVVKVKVLEVDIPRKRIALTMRLADPVTAKKDADEPRRNGKAQQPKRDAVVSGGTMAAAFAKLKR